MARYNNEFDIHAMERPGKCRGCSSSLDKGQKVLHTYTTAGSGMHIYFCEDCQFTMAAMFVEKYDSLDDFGEEIVMRKLNNES